MRSCRPGERSVEPTRAGSVELNSEYVDLRLRRGRHGERRVRRMEDIDELNGFRKPARHERAHLDVDEVTEADPERSVGLMPLDGCLLDSGHLADERAQHRRRPT